MLSMFLRMPVYPGQVVVVTLHGPNSIPFAAECLSRVSADSHVNENGCFVDIQREGAYIVMVMAFVVESTLRCKKESPLALHVAKFGFGVPSVTGSGVGEPVFQEFLLI